jgi:outer membrane murein-binding lipoprotein Lpp
MDLEHLLILLGFILSVIATVSTGAFVFGKLSGRFDSLDAQVQGLMGDSRELSRRIDQLERDFTSLRLDVLGASRKTTKGGSNAV